MRNVYLTFISLILAISFQYKIATADIVIPYKNLDEAIIKADVIGIICVHNTLPPKHDEIVSIDTNCEASIVKCLKGDLPEDEVITIRLRPSIMINTSCSTDIKHFRNLNCCNYQLVFLIKHPSWNYFGWYLEISSNFDQNKIKNMPLKEAIKILLEDFVVEVKSEVNDLAITYKEILNSLSE